MNDPELVEYVSRALSVTPMERFRAVMQMREFTLRHMTEAGRKHLLKRFEPLDSF